MRIKTSHYRLHTLKINHAVFLDIQREEMTLVKEKWNPTYKVHHFKI